MEWQKEEPCSCQKQEHFWCVLRNARRLSAEKAQATEGEQMVRPESYEKLHDMTPLLALQVSERMRFLL